MTIQKILAAVADASDAEKFLTECGFKGLAFKSSEEDMIKFWYKKFDDRQLEKVLGQPKETGGKSIRFDYGTLGVVAIWPQNKVVVLKNSSRVVLKTTPTQTHVPPEIEIPKPQYEPPMEKPEGEQPKGLPPVPGIKEQDDDKTPIIQLHPDMIHNYKLLSSTSSVMAKILFNKRLWLFLNQTKFGGQMAIPHLQLMKAVNPKQMRVRGRWWAVKRVLEVSPNLYNAHQDFFVEIFLHEMCHQAVSEIDKTRDFDAKGHGKIWQKWMVHVGLNPRRFDPNDNTTYMNKDQLFQHTQEQKEMVRKRESVEQQKKEQGVMMMVSPRRHQPCKIVRDGELLKGMLICPATASGNTWAVLTVMQMDIYRKTGKLTWALPKMFSQIYTMGTDTDDDQFLTAEWDKVAQAITRSYASGNVKRTRS